MNTYTAIGFDGTQFTVIANKPEAAAYVFELTYGKAPAFVAIVTN